MRLYLDIIEGPDRGQKISLNSKSSVGRRDADILLNDPKLSGIHAFFDYKEGEGWVIMDQDSRNGVWINGMRELRMVLKDGDEIFMGSTKIICRLLDTKGIQWSQKFQMWIESLLKKVSSTPPAEVKEVNPEIRLKMIQGVQYGETWDIFWGPRKAGRDSLDICLYDDDAPRESFEIRVKGKYAYFYTEQEKKVKLNNKSVKEKQFTPGDIISVGDSRILVEVDEGHGFRD